MTIADSVSLSGLPDDGQVFLIETLELSVLPGPHPFVLDQAGAIAENWRQELARQPAFFDGKILLHQNIRFDGRHLQAQSYLTPFSAFLWWRKQKGRPCAAHLFGVAILVSSDGAVLAVRMGDHTANPGKVYCAAGSLDASDMTGDRVDIFANMQREVAEETGLDLQQAEADGRTYGLWRDRCLTVFRFYRFPLTADELKAAIRAHMVTDHEQEIAAPVAIWTADPDAHPYGHFMPAVLDFFFNAKPEGSAL